jgi:zinc protease
MRRFLACSVLALGCVAGTAQALLPTLPPNARLERLDNGLEVLLLHLPDSPMTGMNLLVKAGSAREDFHTSGMTHMLEHLLFNGTTQLDQAALYAAADRIGAYNNANTGRFYTNFMMLAPTAELSRAMDLQAQMIFHSTLPPEKFEKERGIVLEELAQGADDPAGRDEEQWEDFLLQGSSFALPTLGTSATIRHMDRDQVWDYYRTWYVPNNMLLSVVGGFDPDTVLDEVERWYGQAAPGALPELPLRPLQWQPGSVRTGRASGTSRTLRLAWPAPDQNHPDHLAAGLLAWAAGDPRDGVLPALLFTEGLPPLANLSLIHVDEVGFGRFELSCDLPPELDAEEAIAALTRVVARLGSHTFPGETVSLRLLDQRAEWSQLVEKPHYFGLMQAAAFTQQGFEPVLTRGARLAALRPDDIAACAARWLTGQPPMALLLEPDRESGSARLSLADRHRQSAELDQPAILVEGGRPGDWFALQIIARGRSIWEGPDACGALGLMHRLLPEGAAGQSAAELSTRLRRMGGKLTLADNPAIPYDDHYTSSSHTFLRLECLADHWQSACSLAVDLLLRPDFPGEAFERERANLLERLAAKDGSARARSREVLDSLLVGGLPSALPPEGRAESIAALELEDLRHLHALVYRPENLILAVVGPPPAGEVTACLAGLLSGIPSAPAEQDKAWLRTHSPWLAPLADQRPLVPPRMTGNALAAPAEIHESLGGEMGALRLGTRIQVDPADQSALRLLFAVLNDRVSFDLREERGWAYSIGCWASGQDDRAVLEAYMGTRPENAPEALKALRGYLGGPLKPVTQDELDTVRGGMLGRELMRGLASINQAWRLATGELAGRADQARADEEALRAVTPQDVQRVAARYLQGTPWITVQVL